MNAFQAEHLQQELESALSDIQTGLDTFRAVLSEIRELIGDYVDIRDGYSGPLPNNAMRAQQLIDETLRAIP